MKRFALRNAVVPSCAFTLILVAAACGGVGNSELLDFPPPDSGGAIDTGTSASSSSTTSSGGTTTSSSTSSTSSSGNTVDAGDGGNITDAAPDASDGAVCTLREICGDGIDNDCNGPIDDGCNGIGTYVSEKNGKIGNPGTKADPAKTIAEGIANAVTLGGAQTVYVAEGHYPEKVTLVENVSLLGGHQCSNTPCSWTQDATLYDTAIDDQDGEGVVAPKTITKKTRFEGFRVNGKSGSPSGNPSGACMTLDGSSPVVRGNTFTPGAVSGGSGRAVGVVVFGPTNDPAGAVIDGNAIAGGTGSSSWAGISLDRKINGGATAIAQITRNRIKGGTAPTSLGINGGSSAAATLIQDNDILAGTSSGLGGSWGIQVSSSMTIDGNRINVDTANAGTCSAAAVCGGINSLSSTTTITNNVVFGVRASKSAAVLLAEADGVAGPVALNANYLDGAGVGTLNAGVTTISTAVWLRICQGNACGVGAVLGRLRNDIFIGGINENRYGIYEEQTAARTAHPDKLDADDFFFAPALGRKDFLYHFWNGTTATDLSTTAQIALTLKTTPAPSNLFNVDPAVDATFHLTASTTLVDKGTTTDAPSTDFDGHKRPQGAGVDIGPDESK